MKYRNPLQLALYLMALHTSCQIAPVEGNKYLNESPPALVPEVFAPGTVSSDEFLEFGSVFSQDGKEFYYSLDVPGHSETRVMKFVDGKWTLPVSLNVSDRYSYNDPFLSPDESKLFFISDMPMDGKAGKKDYDIWFIERNGTTWSKPQNAGVAINTDKHEYYISFSKNGTMYFSSNRGTTQGNKKNFDIYSSTLKDGQFQTAVRLDSAVNTPHYEADVFIAWDESYLIFCANRPGGYGMGDLYISLKKPDGSWTEAKNMGPTFNTSGDELCPFVTRDQKYFFYSRDSDIYWVDAKALAVYK